MSQDDLHSQTENRDYKLSDENLGIAGRTARFFIRSPLSPLFYIAMLLMGLLGLIVTPRQEDPQISVPMIDIMVAYPGASAQQVANVAMQPLERIIDEIPGVKHVYSASRRGQGVVTVQFEVGLEMGPSLVKVNEKIASNMDKIPPGVMPPLVQTKGIDDVPIVTLTLWSKDTDGDGRPDVDDGQLRLLAQDVLQGVKEVPNTGAGFIVGGRREQLTVDVYPERLSGYQISLDAVANAIQTANAETTAGGVESRGSHFTVTSGSFLKGADDINRLVVGSRNEVDIYVHDLARVTQGPEDATQLVAYYTGPASVHDSEASGVPAVTVAIAKKPLTNGVVVANTIIERVEEMRGSRIPDNVEVSITRNYGKSADDKVSELIFKLFVATSWVFILVWLAFRALRPAIVVMLVIPVVLLMTIFVAWILEITIDRVSLFALIFSIGILVDDAIVVVENIYRRWLEEGRTDDETAVDAVREVGNPTILATFTVIAALMPMGFVSGMMGPYMAPIPILGSAAMFISLFAAFVFTPYLALSKWLRPSMHYLETAEKREHKESLWLERLFRRLLTPLIESKGKRRLFRLILWGTFLFTCSFFYFKWVAVKMLPLDNKPEYSVVIDMPEGTALPVTANLVHRMAEELRKIKEVTAVQLYVGTARPFDFNGMVRHYYMRSEPWLGELQVQLTDKGERDRTSHEIAVEARELLKPISDGTGASVSVVEMPPGPPVLQSVVAEIHGPSPETRRQLARDLTGFFAQVESTRDVDNYLRDAYNYWRFDVDTEKAVRRGISVDTINRNLGMALGGAEIGDIKHQAGHQIGHEPVRIVMQVPLAERSQVESLGDLPIQSKQGFTVPLQELGIFQQVPEEDIIYHKDLRPVEYVVADVGGLLAAPTYAMFQIQDLIAAADYTAPDGTKLHEGGGFNDGFFWISPPPDDSRLSWEWAGEWTVTFETFRDMGAAFAVALVLIYILVVWEFGNFRIPLVIMAPIPLTLLGIIPAHFFMFELGLGGEFTATSMIGWIALAGIIVRNSILLVDFSIHEIQKGIPVTEAVIRACMTRTRPIMITALALVAGSSVIFTDPIFQGMAISLASGVLVSTVLTLIVIPLGCVAASRDMCEVAAATAPPGVNVPCTMDEEEQVQKSEQAKGSGSGLVKALGNIVQVFVMIFYAIRGIFLLLFDVLKGLFKKKKPKPAAKVPVTTAKTASTGSGSGSSGTPQAPAAPAASSVGETGPAAGAVGSTAVDGNTTKAAAVGGPLPVVDQTETKPLPEDTSSESSPTIAARPASGSIPRSMESQAAGLQTEGPRRADSIVEANRVVETSPDPVESAPKPRDSLGPVNTEQTASKSEEEGALGLSRKGGATKRPARKGAAGKKAIGKKAAPKKVTTKKAGVKSAASSTQQSTQKKAPRRGIRLKVDDGQGPNFH